MNAFRLEKQDSAAIDDGRDERARGEDMAVDGATVDDAVENEIRDFVRRQLAEEIWEEEQRFINPHIHYLDMSPRMYEVKMEILEKSRRP